MPLQFPLSYWRYTRSDQVPYTAHLAQDIAHNKIPDGMFDHYKLNSIFIIGDRNVHSEMEYYYEHSNYPGAYIRLLVISSKNPFPPKLGDQFCFSENLMIEGCSLGYSYLTKEFGPHEAIWTGDKSYLLLVKPMIWTTRSWFLDNVKVWFKRFQNQ